jgi:hypothetical protein
MGWVEFSAWLAQLRRDEAGPEPDPGSWDGTDQAPHWQEMRAKRRKLQGH